METNLLNKNSQLQPASLSTNNIYDILLVTEIIKEAINNYTDSLYNVITAWKAMKTCPLPKNIIKWKECLKTKKERERFFYSDLFATLCKSCYKSQKFVVVRIQYISNYFSFIYER